LFNNKPLRGITGSRHVDDTVAEGSDNLIFLMMGGCEAIDMEGITKNKANLRLDHVASIGVEEITPISALSIAVSVAQTLCTGVLKLFDDRFSIRRVADFVMSWHCSACRRRLGTGSSSARRSTRCYRQVAVVWSSPVHEAPRHKPEASGTL
jgi:hypothetical protein